MNLERHKLLTKEEAKTLLGLESDSALRRLIQRGKLRVVKYSKTSPLRFRQIDVDACLESCAVTGQTEDAFAAVVNATLGPIPSGTQPATPGKAGKEPTP